MPNAVKEAVVDCFVQGRKYTKDEAEKFLNEMIRKKLYQLETWS